MPPQVFLDLQATQNPTKVWMRTTNLTVPAQTLLGFQAAEKEPERDVTRVLGCLESQQGLGRRRGVCGTHLDWSGCGPPESLRGLMQVPRQVCGAHLQKGFSRCHRGFHTYVNGFCYRGQGNISLEV